MKKFELEALGLDHQTIRAIQELAGRDIEQLKRKLQRAPRQDDLDHMRAAIAALLPMIQSQDHLERLLVKAAGMYRYETFRPQDTSAPTQPAPTGDTGLAANSQTFGNLALAPELGTTGEAAEPADLAGGGADQNPDKERTAPGGDDT